MKHNYTLAKERELKLVECLNGNLNDHKFNQIADYIINKLGHQFDSFSHSGSIQTEPGDIWEMLKIKKSLLKLKY